MLICIDCQRTNAPWAKKCSACAADLHAISSNTLISNHPVVSIEDTKALAPESENTNAAPDIKTWSPDNEWHSLDEIDGEKVLDNETIEPISVIDPSRTAEIDWGLSREDAEKFDSTPIHADSKNRFDEYGYDFERANKSAWKTTAILLSGIVGIVMLGGLAISYLHSTTISASPISASSTIEKTAKTESRANSALVPTTVSQTNPSNTIVMTEEVISVTKPMGSASNQINAEKQNPQADTSSPYKKETSGPESPPVFVMSASQPIMAKPEVGKIAASSKKPEPIPTVVQKQVAVAPTTKPVKPSLTKQDAKNVPYPVLVPVPLRPNDVNAQQSDSSGAIKNETMAPVAIAPVTSTAAAGPTRLKDKQSKDCSSSAFLGKVICEERSRVNFCTDRWNSHPDCQLNNNRQEP
jgi:hypothetical protein